MIPTWTLTNLFWWLFWIVFFCIVLFLIKAKHFFNALHSFRYLIIVPKLNFPSAIYLRFCSTDKFHITMLQFIAIVFKILYSFLLKEIFLSPLWNFPRVQLLLSLDRGFPLLNHGPFLGLHPSLHNKYCTFSFCKK